ncbi:LysM peptidoglycan-binding domain-containing protein [Pedobacter sp. LMG 31464]|uniref:LysM peptidoglycan-binding domain-containing protein n=1 Tax=Pedobacter planticolens TaxID=2679964 RepID=A0A923ITB7_9SPHI|nr:LysM peptidoglycan-binding domain-containing protein [Pedobacter planticolens]MBB2144555.1 LysM peptidoglycan-binding domain-containing protein [Pedobacter planticolens]
MHKIYILLLATFSLSISVSHANNKVDSIGVENNNGKKLIVHKVEAKETYYSISRKYNVNYKDVMTYNDSKFLQIGVILKVPTNIPFIASTTSATADNTAVIEHIVKAKDNLNMLAEKYGTTVNEIKRVNNLTSINLQIGQVLKIPASGNTTVQETQTVTAPVVSQPVVASNNNAATIEHAIKPKENLNLLAEKYGTTVDEIKRLNGLSSNNLQIGQVLKIPSTNTKVPEATVEKVIPTPTPKSYQKPVSETPTETTNTSGGFDHTVIAGETIYTIAKRYSLTTYQLKSFNNLTSNELTVGQKLKIIGAKQVTANAAEEENTGSDPNTIKDPSLKYAPSRYGLTQIEEKGAAIWIADQDLDPTKMLILHRTAPVGTIVKITNPMSNRSTFAKVVGKFTENESTKDVIIVMTKAVADAVGALDKRFFCNITYGAQENEQ